MIFNNAAGLQDDAESAALLAVGENQGWKCGTTKLFLKDEVRYLLESALNGLREKKATAVQAAIRGKLAHTYAKKRKSARDKIQEHILIYITRKRWRDTIEKNAATHKLIVIRIQRRFRSKRQRETFMKYIHRRTYSAVIIQTAFRRHWAFEALSRNLFRRREARLRL